MPERRRIIPPTVNQTTGEPSWRWRRIAFFLVLFFSLAMLWRLVDRSDTALNYGIGIGLIWLLAALVLIYTGFATAQDIVAIFVTRTGRPYTPPPGKVETTQTTTTVVEPEPNANGNGPTDPTIPPPGYAGS